MATLTSFLFIAGGTNSLHTKFQSTEQSTKQSKHSNSKLIEQLLVEGQRTNAQIASVWPDNGSTPLDTNTFLSFRYDAKKPETAAIAINKAARALDNKIDVAVLDPGLFDEAMLPLKNATLQQTQEIIEVGNRCISTNMVLIHTIAKQMADAAKDRKDKRTPLIMIMLPPSAQANLILPGASLQASVGAALRQYAIGLQEDVRIAPIKITTLLLASINIGTKKAASDNLSFLNTIIDYQPDKFVQPSDVFRTIEYLVKSSDTVHHKEIVMQSPFQPNRGLRKFVTVGPWLSDEKIRFNMSIAKDATEEGIEFSKRPWAIVTGASEGIGRSTVLQLAQLGYDIVLISRNADRLESAASECRRYGVLTIVYSVDVADLERFKAVVSDCVKRFGTRRLQVVVNNAGLSRRSSIVRANPEKLDETMRVNYTAAQYLTTWIAPVLARNRRGAIIFMNSMAVNPYFMTASGVSSYYASKFALAGFASVIWEDLRAFNVKVTSLFVGLVNNNLGTKPGPVIYRASQMIQNEDVSRAVAFAVGHVDSNTACPTHMFLSHLRPIHDTLAMLSQNQLADEQQPSHYAKL